jgi:hypothetical protein
MNGQVIFKCGWDAPSREDILSELQIFGMEDYTYKLPHGNLTDGHAVKSSGYLSRMLLSGLVDQYTRRKLTHQCDILNAFAGIADMLSTEGAIELCFGLDNATLGLGLLWQSGFLKRRVGFPSWSWAGWVGPVRMVHLRSSEAKWIAKTSWIHWYLFDPQKEFQLLPQLEWKPAVSVDDDSKPPPEDKSFLNPSGADTNITESDGVDPTPEYMNLLDKRLPLPDLDSNCLGVSDSPPATRSLSSLSVNPASKLPDYTLLFQTLKARVWMSIYDPLDQVKQYTTHVHLYGESFKYPGVAWINDSAFWTQAGYALQDTSNGRKFPVDIAVLSGPEPPTAMVQQTYVWPETTQEAESPLRSARFYRVMLLAQGGTAESESRPQTHKRVGLGEVRADLVENWDGLRWEDILLV